MLGPDDPLTSTPTDHPDPLDPGSSDPTADLDPSNQIGVQWQITTTPHGDGGAPDACTANPQIDDVKFY